MTVRLTIDGENWRRQVDRIARGVDGLIPVVKGNGYGLGRVHLAGVAGHLADTIAVGSIHEIAGLPAGVDVVVLSPAHRLAGDIPSGRRGPILTIGSLDHVRLLGGWRGRVVIKLASSMHRFGIGPEGLGVLAETAAAHHLDVVAFSLHPPTAGSDDDHRAEIERWLDVLGEEDEVWVSHLSPTAFRSMQDRWPDRRFRLRMGTGLWHADKSLFGLHADVLHTEAVSAGDVAGYRSTLVPFDATMAVVGCGTVHGVHRLPGGLSPFHFQRRRLDLLEPPHMHTSMVLIPADQPPPAVGSWVDVQWPLINVHADVLRWEP